MSDRIGGAFPDDRPGGADKPATTDRPRSTGRPADRRTSFGAGGAGNRAGGRTGQAGTAPGRGQAPTGTVRPAATVRTGTDGTAPRRPSRWRVRPAEDPESITEDQLSREVRDELGGLPADLAAVVGRYLVAAELATDPELAYGYAQAARHLAARIGVVREVSGITAYKTGRWAEALAELRAARRLTGRNELPAADGGLRAWLGRLDRALELVHSAEASGCRAPRRSSCASSSRASAATRAWPTPPCSRSRSPS